MTILIEGEPKEIADLLLTIESQQPKKNDFEEIVNGLCQLMKTSSENYGTPPTSACKPKTQE